MLGKSRHGDRMVASLLGNSARSYISITDGFDFKDPHVLTWEYGIHSVRVRFVHHSEEKLHPPNPDYSPIESNAWYKFSKRRKTCPGSLSEHQATNAEKKSVVRAGFSDETESSTMPDLLLSTYL